MIQRIQRIDNHTNSRPSVARKPRQTSSRRSPINHTSGVVYFGRFGVHVQAPPLWSTPFGQPLPARTIRIISSCSFPA
jgi:hypothetical protein